jgi:DMSO/TMAO reductase YedYZ molybdopterin-dependent catalytic subunit
MLRTETRAGFVAGLLATIALVGLLRLASALAGLSFIPYDFADTIIRLTPGAIATQGIETLGAIAKLLVKLGAIVAFVLGGGALGAIAAAVAARNDSQRDSRGGVARNAAAFTLFIAMLALALLNQQATERSVLEPVPFAALLILALGWGAALGVLTRRLTPAPSQAAARLTSGSDDSLAPVQADRRAFLVRSGAAAITVAIGSAALAELLGGESPATAASATLPPPARLTPEPEIDLSGFAAPPGVRPRLTPQSELYYVSSRVRDPRVDAASYRLTIDGVVERPLSLTIDEIMSRPRVIQTSTLECISNDVGGDLIGNCRWVGTPLADVIAEARLMDGAQRIALYGADGYVDSISVQDALRPTTLLVYGVDDEPLTVPHGYPLRLIVPNIFGMKNVKWIERIEAVDYDLQGFWQQRGWSQPAIVQTTSVIDSRVVTREDGAVPIGGIAFAGSRGIERVEVQIDDSGWAAAELEPESSPLQWRRWRYDWQPEPGQYRVRVRAIDGAGEPQVEAIAPPHPDGATGYHAVRVTVRP